MCSPGAVCLRREEVKMYSRALLESREKGVREMTRRIQWVALSLATLVLMPLTAFGAMPQSASLATAAVGSQNNAWGNGIATIIGRHTPITVRVQPFAGRPARMPSKP